MKVSKSMSTADVPPQFLKATFLVGRIPFKTLGTEPQVSYTLYVPDAHYNPDPSIRNTKGAVRHSSVHQLPKLPLVVSIHGTGRAAEQCRNSLISFADEARVAVLAPLFPVGSEFYNSLSNYKVLRHEAFHADTALFDILDEVKDRWPGIATDKVFMMGFSGGGQFTHRFMYLYPERLHAVSVGAPGRVTMLDNQLKWPAGVRDGSEIFGVPVDVDKIRQVTIQLIAGARDTETHGGDEFWDWLDNTKAKHSERSVEGDHSSNPSDGLGRGGDRVQRLKRLKEDWERRGIYSQLHVVKGASHEREKVLTAVIDFLQPLVARAAEVMENTR